MTPVLSTPPSLNKNRPLRLKRASLVEAEGVILIVLNRHYCAKVDKSQIATLRNIRQQSSMIYVRSELLILIIFLRIICAYGQSDGVGDLIHFQYYICLI